ncbi:MAG: hypothetical protein PW786_00025 [Arachidicoccus sp.]|nr:hypothetical protein [Arachidicoccus sp.]
MKKTILFGYPEDYYISELIRENIRYSLAGEKYEIIDIAFSKKFKYKNFGQRLNNFLRKTFLRDKTYKVNLKFSIHEKEISYKLKKFTEVDYIFLIRPDVYPEYFIKKLRQLSKKMIAYQWDGLNRFPLTYKIIHYFDRFFVFDPKDIDHSCKNLFFITNFYFDLPRFLDIKDIPQKNELYYIGTFDKRRIKETEQFIYKTKDIPINKNVLIRLPKHRLNYAKKSTYGIQFLMNEIVSFEKNIQMAKSAKVLLEFVNISFHKGLTFRALEALCFDKKLITNNPEIVHYDFYKKENIFIIGQDDDLQLENFINSSYVAIAPSIKEKYSFTNWIKYILDIPPYSPITPPTIY